MRRICSPFGIPAMSKGCAPVLASYSAMTRFTCSMSAVAGSYSRRVVSPTDENVRILAFMFGLLWTFVRGFLREATARFGSCGHIAPFSHLSRTLFLRDGVVLRNLSDSIFMMQSSEDGPFHATSLG